MNRVLTEGGVLPPAVAPSAQDGEPAFDPVAKLKQLGLWWLNGSGCYFMAREDRFLELGPAEVRRKLKVRGFRAKPDTDAGEKVSQVDLVLDAATEHHSVDYAGSLAGMMAGVYDLPAGRLLVREGPRLVKPEPGSCTAILEFLSELLGREGADYFCAWLKVAYEALAAGERRQGQALILIGPPGCGKSRIQHFLITPMLGGRSADPKSFMFEKTDFNSELVGSEHLLIEEVPSGCRTEDRMRFGERLKEICANDTARLHRKSREAFTVSPFWRVSVSLNDNPEKLRSLPPMTEDVSDKVILLKVNHAPKYWERFAAASDPRRAFREAIQGELGAFAAMLRDWTIPARLVGTRYGVRSYIEPDLAQTLFESEPEALLLLLVDKCLWDDPDGDEKREPWRGDAEDLRNRLTDDASPVRVAAQRLLNSYPTACGQYLARLANRFPDRIQRKRTAQSRDWIIHPPAAAESALPPRK